MKCIFFQSFHSVGQLEIEKKFPTSITSFNRRLLLQKRAFCAGDDGQDYEHQIVLKHCLLSDGATSYQLVTQAWLANQIRP